MARSDHLILKVPCQIRASNVKALFPGGLAIGMQQSGFVRRE